MAEPDALSTPCNVQISEVTCDSFRAAWAMTPVDTARVTHYFIDLSRKEGAERNRFRNRVRTIKKKTHTHTGFWSMSCSVNLCFLLMKFGGGGVSLWFRLCPGGKDLPKLLP